MRYDMNQVGQYTPIIPPDTGGSMPYSAGFQPVNEMHRPYNPAPPPPVGRPMPMEVGRGYPPTQQPYAPGYDGRWPMQAPPYQRPEKPGDKERNWMAPSGLVCGIASIPCLMSPVAALLIGLTGIILSIKAMKSQRRGLSIAGIVCSCLGLAGALLCFIAIIADPEFINVFV